MITLGGVTNFRELIILSSVVMKILILRAYTLKALDVFNYPILEHHPFGGSSFFQRANYFEKVWRLQKESFEAVLFMGGCANHLKD